MPEIYSAPKDRMATIFYASRAKSCNTWPVGTGLRLLSPSDPGELRCPKLPNNFQAIAPRAELADVRPTMAEVGKIWSKVAGVGRLGPTLTKVGPELPSLSQVWPKLAELDQPRVNVGQLGRNLADGGPILVIVRQLPPQFGPDRPNLANFANMSPKLGQNRCWPNSAHSWWGQCFDTVGQTFRRSSPGSPWVAFPGRLASNCLDPFTLSVMHGLSKDAAMSVQLGTPDVGFVAKVGTGSTTSRQTLITKHPCLLFAIPPAPGPERTDG